MKQPQRKPMSQAEKIQHLIDTKPRLDRADIAQLIGESVDVVTKNEARLGIAPARYNINARTVRYHTIQAIDGLKSSGAIQVHPAPSSSKPS